MKSVLRIATRRSRLALWQAQWVARLLAAAHPDLLVELVPMRTEGDRRLDASLAKIGGKGLFIKELEHALTDGRADLAVHSMKDVPASMPPGFEIAAVLPREDPRDALVSAAAAGLDDLPVGAVVGTSSLRRQAQIRHHRRDLRVAPLRGNVDTRLARAAAGEFDAIVLAAAGLKRLGFEERIVQYLAPDLSLPAAAQGAVGIECRTGDEQTRRYLAPLDDASCRAAMIAERSFCRALGADCTSPVAALATLNAHTLTLDGRVAAADGERMLDETQSGPLDDAAGIGARTASRLLERGAGELLETDGHG